MSSSSSEAASGAAAPPQHDAEEFENEGNRYQQARAHHNLRERRGFRLDSAFFGDFT